MSTPIISIIVPVYKVEQYLPQCVESILNQTFTNFELLLIDDGSPDRSGLICDEYAAKDSRIQVFHKDNGGVSSARNLGLDNARGEWIIFVDSDDCLSLNCFEIIFSLINDPLIDFIQFNVTDLDLPSFESLKIISKVIPSDDFLRLGLLSPGIAGKVLNRSLISSIRFNTELSIAEDFLFMCMVVLKATKILEINNKMYFYRKHLSSAMNNLTAKKVFDNFTVIEILNKFLIKENNLSIDTKSFLKFCIGDLIVWFVISFILLDISLENSRIYILRLRGIPYKLHRVSIIKRMIIYCYLYLPISINAYIFRLIRFVYV